MLSTSFVVALCYAGKYGFPSLFICSRPAGMSSQEALSRMGTHLAAKKRQLRSDRALGLRPLPPGISGQTGTGGGTVHTVPLAILFHKLVTAGRSLRT
jgi:hypothetical protein